MSKNRGSRQTVATEAFPNCRKPLLKHNKSQNVKLKRLQENLQLLFVPPKAPLECLLGLRCLLGASKAGTAGICGGKKGK